MNYKRLGKNFSSKRNQKNNINNSNRKNFKIIVPHNTLNIHGNKLLNVGYYSNFSLLFRNYVPWRKDDHQFDKEGWGNFENFTFDYHIIYNLLERTNAIANAFKKEKLLVRHFEMKTAWRLISGIGASSSLEVGITLHHVYGVPFIPSSSLKGLLRYYLNQHENYENNKIKKWFGSDDPNNSLEGKIVFLDAFPDIDIQLRVDIMNNHYQKYYQEKEWPGDWMDPNPVKFLTLKNTTFHFWIIARDRSIDDAELSEVEKKMKEALKILGVGAKTAVGYGRFK